jgi:hypothetical protein
MTVGQLVDHVRQASERWPTAQRASLAVCLAHWEASLEEALVAADDAASPDWSASSERLRKPSVSGHCRPMRSSRVA